MSAAICIILLLIILESALQGYRKGMIGIIIPILCCMLAFVFSSSSETILGDVPDTIASSTSGSLQQVIQEYRDSLQREGLEHLLPDSSPHKQIMQGKGTSFLKNRMISDSQIYMGTKNSVVFSVTYLCFYIVLNLVLNIFTHTLVIGTVNRIVGVCLGVLLAIIKIWVIMIILEFICSVVPPLKEVSQILHSSALYQLIQNNNPIMKR